MKKITLLLFLFLILFSRIETVNAATGSIRARASSTNVVLGNNVNVTVTVSGSIPIGSWEYVLDYDKSKLQLTSTTPPLYNVDVGNGSITTKSYTYRFRTTNPGSATVRITNALLIDYNNVQKMNITTPGTTINITRPQVITKSNDSSLSKIELSKGELSPSFNKNITEYEVKIDEIIDKINIKAITSNSKASVNNDGDVSLSEGKNAIDIVVTAENGNKTTYKLNINVIDENPIHVLIDEKAYTLVKNESDLNIPNNFKKIDFPIQGIDVVAYENETIDMILVVLKDEDGKISLYSYNEDEEYKLYNEFQTGTVRLYIDDFKEKNVNNFKKTTLEINEIKLDAMQSEIDEDFYIVYAMNVTNGEYDYYLYDSAEETFQRFLKQENIENTNNNNNKIFIILVAILSTLTILLLLYIPIFIKMNKNRKQKKAL